MSEREMKRLSEEMRILIIKMLTEAKSGHPGGSLSAIDLLTVLWFSEMRGVDGPGNLSNQRDRFVLSKGHGVPALYAVLAKKGFIKESDLMTLRKTGSFLQGHPDRVRMPIVEASTGSLGQGLSVALGLAIAQKMDGMNSRVFCLLGDGEIQEGQVWEAAMSAPKFGVSNLIAILDYNKGQIDGPVSEVMPIEPVADKWKSFGWEVISINGHDFGQIKGAYQKTSELLSKGSKKPVMIIADTVKGKGVSFMENVIDWHGVAPNMDQQTKAIAEIEARMKTIS